MKVIALKEFGGSTNFEVKEIPKPIPQNNEVLIKVHAISINPIDSKTRRGLGVSRVFKDRDPMIVGWDVSGEITQSNSVHFKPGDEVFGMLEFPGQGGAYAEYVVAREQHITHKPKTSSHEQAAAASLAALTAMQSIFEVGKLQAGQKILIHAASGGVGHYAIQMAKAVGAYVIGTSSAKNKEFILGLGADEHIDYRSVDFAEIARDMDLVFDPIGGDNLRGSLHVLKEGGHLVTLIKGYPEGLMEDAKKQNKHFHYHSVYASGKDMEAIADLLSTGTIKSHIEYHLRFDELIKAHDLIDTGRTVGKITLTL